MRWNDYDAAKKGAEEYTHYYKWNNGVWEEINNKAFDYLMIGREERRQAYRRFRKYEKVDGKPHAEIFYYLTPEEEKEYLENLSDKGYHEKLYKKLSSKKASGGSVEQTPDQLERKQQVAKTIYSQLGKGTMFMLGAYDIFTDSNSKYGSLEFKIRGSKKWKHIKIELNAMDTYDITFTTWHRTQTSDNLKREKVEGVYDDMLHSVIENHTGLYTRIAQGGSILNQEKDLLGEYKRPSLLTLQQYLHDRGYTDEFDKKIAIKSYKNWVFSDLDKYKLFISEGRMTAADAKAIIESAGLEVPSDVLNATPQAPDSQSQAKIEKLRSTLPLLKGKEKKEMQAYIESLELIQDEGQTAAEYIKNQGLVFKFNGDVFRRGKKLSKFMASYERKKIREMKGSEYSAGGTVDDYIIIVHPIGAGFKPHWWKEGGIFKTKQSAELQAKSIRKMKDRYSKVEVVPLNESKYYEGGTVDGFKLIYETWSPVMRGNGVSGTIRTVPENYYVATIDEQGKISFSDIESVTRNINKQKVRKLYESGKIEKKENKKFAAGGLVEDDLPLYKGHWYVLSRAKKQPIIAQLTGARAYNYTFTAANGTEFTVNMDEFEHQLKNRTAHDFIELLKHQKQLGFSNLYSFIEMNQKFISDEVMNKIIEETIMVKRNDYDSFHNFVDGVFAAL